MPELVLFQTGNIKFALDRNCISRIRPVPEGSTGATGRIQQQPIEFEGRDLLLIDLAAATNQDTATSYPTNAEMIVVKGSPLALMADQVTSTLDLNGHRMDELPPVFGGTAGACFPNVLHIENQLVLVIDPDALADVETYAANLRARPKTECPMVEDEQAAPHCEKGLPHTSSEPDIGDPLDAVVGQKLRDIIGRRVKQVVAQTMTRVLEQQLL